MFTELMLGVMPDKEDTARDQICELLIEMTKAEAGSEVRAWKTGVMDRKG